MRSRYVSLSRVVVTGLGALSPNGEGVDAFWKATVTGRSGIRTIEGFETCGLACRLAGQVREFTPEAWLPPRDLRNVSRAVPMAIAAGREALKNAGLDPAALDEGARRNFGVVLGSGGGCIEFTERQYQNYFHDSLRLVSLYNIPSSTIGSLSSELSTAFRLHGPSHVLSTGCTSSTDAIGYAFLQLRYGRIQAALSGGVDATVTPGILAGFCMMKILSTAWNENPARASRPFDRQRDGFVLGEGAWMLVLETLERAQARGAPILAEIAGYGSACEAFHRVRLAESGREPARAMQLAIEDSGLAKDEISYLNLHGTSTVLNDRVETQAAKLCFGRRAYQIPMSSLKSMIGHPQGASGAAGAVAAILAIQSGLLPPTTNYEVFDPECDLDYVPNVARRARVDAALANCLGFGSKSSALVIRRFAP
ncbi:MAG: beta-ketoacyl-[acyl-carrier-protein] synthase family protein [Planctomycetes bacterium]|nr:beta-ketoacyl-[acyl-carrier-protein] synthase family protein [Planctomycetota bacterium]